MNFEKLRQKMVSEQLRTRGIDDGRVLKAMGEIKREEFLPISKKQMAYEDRPIRIGHGATISQPYVVALTCQIAKLEGGERVLEVGAGSGYQAVVLGKLAKYVYGVEIVSELAKKAKQRMKKMEYKNVFIIEADGRKGLVKKAPFDVIVSAAAVSIIPKTWREQLKEGGRIVTPVKNNGWQKMIRLRKVNGKFVRKSFGLVSFVDLI